MSGTKYSQIQIEREQKLRQEALGRIRELSALIQAQKENIRAVIAQLSEGVKESFSNEIERARLFLDKSVQESTNEMNSGELNRLVTKLEEMSKEGVEVLSLLIDIKEVRREQRAKRLIGELEILKAEFGGLMPLARKWKATEVSRLVNAFDETLSMIEKENFSDAERKITNLRGDFARLKGEVTTLEEQDNQRRYVLECLRKVCMDMGWDETMEPHLEGESPDSALLFEVDTYSSGKMLFRLTLEGINVNSPITNEGNKCYRQFNDLSEKLKTFGVITKFERVQPPDEEPKLIRKGELDLPNEEREEEKEV
jgi:hypothetical protein